VELLQPRDAPPEWVATERASDYRSGSQQRELVVNGGTMDGEHGVLAAWWRMAVWGEEWKAATAGDEGTRRSGAVERSATTSGRRPRLASRRTT
jgi:hypothetical protein